MDCGERDRKMAHACPSRRETRPYRAGREIEDACVGSSDSVANVEDPQVDRNEAQPYFLEVDQICGMTTRSVAVAWRLGGIAKTGMELPPQRLRRVSSEAGVLFRTAATCVDLGARGPGRERGGSAHSAGRGRQKVCEAEPMMPAPCRPIAGRAQRFERVAERGGDGRCKGCGSRDPRGRFAARRTRHEMRRRHRAVLEIGAIRLKFGPVDRRRQRLEGAMSDERGGRRTFVATIPLTKQRNVLARMRVEERQQHR
ncbi:Uncharacterised protein [Burkholderia oklahomensis]|nr:hypothetical protein BG90_3274 [Burkholderia oklahomensis C6786]SUW55666.1 Uncharacterised protein [Burkholderia oklahomensis]